MNSRTKSQSAWNEIRATLNRGGVARVSKEHFPHPRDAGARPNATWPAGQIADYAIDAPPEPPLMVREYSDHFEAFLAGAQMATHAARVAEADPKAAMYLGGALFGGAMGAAMSNKREGALVGAGLGLLFAAVVSAAIDDEK